MRWYAVARRIRWRLWIALALVALLCVYIIITPQPFLRCPPVARSFEDLARGTPSAHLSDTTFDDRIIGQEKPRCP